MVIPRIGLPADPAQWGALALGAAALVWGRRIAAIARRHERAAVLVLALAAALLSWGYTRAYLRGGPRIIDATSYYLEARGFAEGRVSWPTGEPETSVLGRFLVRSEDAAGARAAVLFPAGYPLLLALGFRLGAPLAIGPLLAALLVLATYALGREVIGEGDPAGAEEPGSEELASVPLIAAALSAVCGALRYHTADTMSHGLAALCFTCATAFLLRSRRRLRVEPQTSAGGSGGAAASSSGVRAASSSGVRAASSSGARAASSSGARLASLRSLFRGAGTAAFRDLALAGLFGGWLFATRPASGIAWAVTAALVIKGLSVETAAAPKKKTQRWSAVAAVALGALPMLIVFLAHQRLATGRFFASTHAVSYAANDGPPGCFRYGFGEGIGCYGEHGDFVRANLAHGFGAAAALKTTARRLWMHLVDPANLELLALLVPVGAWLGRSRPAVRALAGAVAIQIAAYAPFYFDGNYPGGGARFFADVLPIEHVLLAFAAARLGALAAARSGTAQGAQTAGSEEGARARSGALAALGGFARRSPAWLVGLALVGFAFRAGLDHAQLRDRDGGAPLFSAAALAERGVAAGLVFTDTDAAFNLAFDPAARAASGIEVVRQKGDALDALAWRERGSPPAFRARFEVPPGAAFGHTVIEPYAPDAAIAGGSPSPAAGSGSSLIAANGGRSAAVDGGSLWPPRAQDGGAYALPVSASGTCASAARVLRLYRGPEEAGAVRVGVPAKLAAGAKIEIAFLLGAPAAPLPEAAFVEVLVVADGAAIARGSVAIASGMPVLCAPALRAAVPAGARNVEIRLIPRWDGAVDPDLQPLIALDRVIVAPPAL